MFLSDDYLIVLKIHLFSRVVIFFCACCGAFRGSSLLGLMNIILLSLFPEVNLSFLIAAHALSSSVAFSLGVWAIGDRLVPTVSMVAMVASTFSIVRPVFVSTQSDHLCLRLSLSDDLSHVDLLMLVKLIQLAFNFIVEFFARFINLF